MPNAVPFDDAEHKRDSDGRFAAGGVVAAAGLAGLASRRRKTRIVPDDAPEDRHARRAAQDAHFAEEAHRTSAEFEHRRLKDNKDHKARVRATAAKHASEKAGMAAHHATSINGLRSAVGKLGEALKMRSGSKIAGSALRLLHKRDMDFEAKHARAEDGKFTSKGSRSMPSPAAEYEGKSGYAAAQRRRNAVRIVSDNTLSSKQRPHGEGRAPDSIKRSVIRNSSVWATGDKIAELPKEYTGSKTRERPVGSFLHHHAKWQVPKAKTRAEHDKLVSSLAGVVQDNRAGAIEKATERGYIPEKTERRAINAAYNHAALHALHEFGVVDYDAKMDDHMKAEMKPLEGFIRFAQRRIQSEMLGKHKGEWRPYRAEFGQRFPKPKFEKITLADGRRISSNVERLRVRPNKVLIKTVGLGGLTKAFDESRVKRAGDGQFSAHSDSAQEAAGAVGTIAGAAAATTATKGLIERKSRMVGRRAEAKVILGARKARIAGNKSIFASMDNLGAQAADRIEAGAKSLGRKATGATGISGMAVDQVAGAVGRKAGDAVKAVAGAHRVADVPGLVRAHARLRGGMKYLGAKKGLTALAVIGGGMAGDYLADKAARSGMGSKGNDDYYRGGSVAGFGLGAAALMAGKAIKGLRKFDEGKHKRADDGKFSGDGEERPGAFQPAQAAGAAVGSTFAATAGHKLSQRPAKMAGEAAGKAAYKHVVGLGVKTGASAMHPMMPAAVRGYARVAGKAGKMVGKGGVALLGAAAGSLLGDFAGDWATRKATGKKGQDDTYRNTTILGMTTGIAGMGIGGKLASGFSRSLKRNKKLRAVAALGGAVAGSTAGEMVGNAWDDKLGVVDAVAHGSHGTVARLKALG